MREKISEKNISQQQIFRAIDISDKYGYKLISGEKHTRQRDVILKLCIAGRFSIEETDEALILYGMAPLYMGNSRDTAIMTAINGGIREISDMNKRLTDSGFEPLYESKHNSAKEEE